MLARWTDPVETGEFDDDDQGGLDEDEDKEEDGGVEAVDAVGEEELAEDA